MKAIRILWGMELMDKIIFCQLDLLLFFCSYILGGTEQQDGLTDMILP